MAFVFLNNNSIKDMHDFVFMLKQHTAEILSKASPWIVFTCHNHRFNHLVDLKIL